MSREMLGFSIFERCPLIWKMENPLISTDALEQQLLVVVGTGAAPCPPYETECLLRPGEVLQSIGLRGDRRSAPWR